MFVSICTALLILVSSLSANHTGGVDGYVSCKGWSNRKRGGKLLWRTYELYLKAEFLYRIKQNQFHINSLCSGCNGFLLSSIMSLPSILSSITHYYHISSHSSSLTPPPEPLEGSIFVLASVFDPTRHKEAQARRLALSGTTHCSLSLSLSSILWHRLLACIKTKKKGQ